MKRFNLDRQTILIFLLLFPHMKPPSLEYLAPLLETAFDMGRLVSAVLIVLLIVAERKKISPALLLFAALEFWIIAMTALFNRRYVVGAVINCSSVVIVFAIIEYYARRCPDKLLHALMANLGWIVVANLITVIIFYPSGIYSADGNHGDFFLGQKNSFITFVLPAITVALLYFCSGRRASALIIIGAGAIPVFKVWSATSVVGLLLLGLVLLLGLRGKNRLLRPTIIWLVTVVADYLIAVYRILDRPGPLNTFITQVLHKNTTLTGRTAIWDAFYQMFFRRPITGYGFRKYIDVGDRVFFHAHNSYFQFLLMGGVIALVLFLLYNLAVLYRMERQPSSRVTVILTAALAAVYVMHLSEAENSIMSAIVLALANNAAYFDAWLCGAGTNPEPDPFSGEENPEEGIIPAGQEIL